MPERRRIGILGGTFDPIHSGHMDVAAAAQRTLGLSHVYVITASVPPHRAQPSASSFHRFAMTAIAVAGLDGWIASDVELRMLYKRVTMCTLDENYLGEFSSGGTEDGQLMWPAAITIS